MGQVGFLITSVIYLTAGTMLMMWLGEQITQRGIGNGVSLLITVGILATLPGAAAQTYQFFFGPVGTNTGHGMPLAVFMILLFFVVTMGIIMVVQGQRKIPVQYAKRVVGNKVMGGQSSFLPLKVNYSGVMPVIFAQAILLFPQQIMSQLGAAFNLRFLTEFSAEPPPRPLDLLHRQRAADPVLQLFLGLGHVQADPDRRRPEEVRRLHSRACRPGEPTAQFLDFIMTRLTLAGAIFLTIIAVMPDILLFELNVPVPDRLFLRRHGHADHGGRHPGHDAPDRDVPPPAPL